MERFAVIAQIVAERKAENGERVMQDITVVDSIGGGWTIRFLDRKEFAALKARENFGQQALRVAKMKDKWQTSGAFRGALSYTDGKIIALQPRNEQQWLKERGLTRVQM